MKLLVAGDLHVNKNSSFSIDNLSEKISKNDYFLFNLEGPALNNKIPSVPKNGPNLSMDVDTLSYLSKYYHKIIMSGANNHMGDFGEDGVFSTLKFFKENEILNVGCGINRVDAAKPLILKDNVAIVAIAENEFGMANDTKAGANPLKIEEQLIQVMHLAREGYHVVIYFHGGNENSPIPNPFIKRLFKSFIDAGAKVVIGSHTHCPQGYETYKQGLIFYSFGNFIFDKPEVPYSLKDALKQKVKKFIRGEKSLDFWNIGYLVEIDLNSKTLNYEIIPIMYENKKVQIMEGKQKENFMKYLKQLSDINNNQEEYLNLWNNLTYLRTSLFQKRISEFSYVEVGKEYQKFLAFRNLITCESHRELLLNMNFLVEEGTLEQYHDVAPIQFLKNPSNFGI